MLTLIYGILLVNLSHSFYFLQPDGNEEIIYDIQDTKIIKIIFEVSDYLEKSSTKLDTIFTNICKPYKLDLKVLETKKSDNDLFLQIYESGVIIAKFKQAYQEIDTISDQLEKDVSIISDEAHTFQLDDQFLKFKIENIETQGSRIINIFEDSTSTILIANQIKLTNALVLFEVLNNDLRQLYDKLNDFTLSFKLSFKGSVSDILEGLISNLNKDKYHFAQLQFIKMNIIDDKPTFFIKKIVKRAPRKIYTVIPIIYSNYGLPNQYYKDGITNQFVKFKSEFDQLIGINFNTSSCLNSLNQNDPIKTIDTCQFIYYNSNYVYTKKGVLFFSGSEEQLTQIEELTNKNINANDFPFLVEFKGNLTINDNLSNKITISRTSSNAIVKSDLTNNERDYLYNKTHFVQQDLEEDFFRKYIMDELDNILISSVSLTTLYSLYLLIKALATKLMRKNKKKPSAKYVTRKILSHR